MAYLALAWKVAGYKPVVTRTAMLAVAAFTVLGLFRLARRVANWEVAIASSICTALYPVFFAQSTLAHLDLAAAGFTFWGLLAYIGDRRVAMAVWFSLAVLTKETAILAPLALLAWELVPNRGDNATRNQRRAAAELLALFFPLIPLGLWYAYHYHRTGFVLGNPEFFRYNVQETLHPLRILLAFGLRLWQVLGYLGLYLLTLTALLAMSQPALADESGERPRIAFHIQLAFLSVILAYVLAMAVVGGAVLARYMLPVVPLVIIICVSTLRRRVPYWPAVVVIVVLAFVAALFVNPPYGLSLEDNLAYRDYIRLHQNAENFLGGHYSQARVLTAWPASDELTRPCLGYVAHPMRVLRIEDFTVEQLMSAAEFRPQFDVAFVFSTKYEPPHPWFEHWRLWQRWKTEFFGYHRDIPPAAAARLLGGTLVYSDRRDGQWVGVIDLQQVQEARADLQ
jgi:4-amino-4-deoxy-L-arabinose transferase-like glycosyltransferase